MKKKSFIIYGGIALAGLLLLYIIYNSYLSPTKIAYVNYQEISLGSINRANNNPFINIYAVDEEDLTSLPKYDMIFINGMGLRIVEEQRAFIKKLAEKGKPIYTSSATNPENNINSLDSIKSARVAEYMRGGGTTNTRSLLNYIRNEIDNKLIYRHEPDSAVPRSTDPISHAAVGKDSSEDNVTFPTVKEYEDWLKAEKIWTEGGQKVFITGQMSNTGDLVAKLEEVGLNVYPIGGGRTLYSMLDEVQPDLVINLPHGRMGDRMVDWLKERNIPLLTPISILKLVEDWENDPMGLSGGFLSQSVVTPEIDGGIRSFALFAQYKDENGWRHSFAVPERLETFVETIQKFLALRTKPNSEKRVAIYYLRGAGQGARVGAGGMEGAPSIYNFLKRLKDEGYNLEGLPANHRELEEMISMQGAVFGSYADGAIAEFMKVGSPELISKEDYESWVTKSLRPEKYKEVVDANGEFPGQYMTSEDGRLGIARLQFGNVVLVPQNAAGTGTNNFAMVHGTGSAPPHPYIASYLWMQYGFKADALIHFGTHGSLEFTPKKQVGLSSLDWPDRLVGAVPHFYIYSIANVGEGVIAKRRSYAALTSYLTPPFLESNVRGLYRELEEKIKIYNNRLDNNRDDASLAVKEATIKLGIHRDLELDSIPGKLYTADDIQRIENFAEELATEKITGQLYTMGVPYENIRIISSVVAIASDPIAYSVWALDKLKERADEQAQKNKTVFTTRYLEPAKALVNRVLQQPLLATDDLVCQIARISKDELAKAREITSAGNAPTGMMAMMAGGGSSSGRAGSTANRSTQVDSTATQAGRPQPTEYTKDEKRLAAAIMEIERTVKNINNYKTSLLNSPEAELASNMNALGGGYIAPSPGGDPIANPNTLPTGRNLYSINAEATPSESAWDKGVQLAEGTIELYRKRHNGEYPRKVSYTLWAGEFIETEGATIAQIFYMLGVEPIRDAFGRVSDFRLIPSKDLGRPRIDVVVQTSGQLRDIAASRLFLINRAVEMAAEAKDDEYTNQVMEGVVEAQRVLIDKGISPKDAQEIATYRVFGGANGRYGTGIQGMVESGDRWETETEIAEVYLNNMGAFYGREKDWEKFRQFAFEAALTRTDVVIQPRQSNTWGALSLDHMYEFMGGLNLAVRHVTGKDPDAYLSDYRNRNNVRIQELKESIGVESRTTIFNPTYIQEKMKGEASSAGVFAETIRNTYAWNVMKPSVIDNELWDEVYNVYVKDKFDLKVDEFFKQENPAALQEITAVMLETVRKGMWKATEQQVRDIAVLHTELIKEYDPSCSGFVCNNMKLIDFIAANSSAQAAREYTQSINNVRQAPRRGTVVAAETTEESKGVVLKKDEDSSTQSRINDADRDSQINNMLIAFVVLVVLITIFFIYGKKKRKKD